MPRSPLTRSVLLLAGVLLAAAVILHFYGRSERRQPEGVERQVEAFPEPGAGGSKLTVSCPEGMLPQAVRDGFTKDTGLRLDVVPYSSVEEMLARVRSNDPPDVVVLREHLVPLLSRSGLLRQLASAQIRNLENVDPDFTNLPYDPGGQFSIPLRAGVVGIVVNTAKVNEDIRGFDDVFREQNRGNIVVLDDAREIAGWALAVAGRPMNELNNASLKSLGPVLARWLPLVRFYDSDNPDAPLLNGDVAIGVLESGDAAKLLRSDARFQWILPVEGTHLFLDCMVVPSAGRNPAGAWKFLDYMLRPEVARELAVAQPAISTNRAARDKLPEDLRGNPALAPVSPARNHVETFQDAGPQGAKVEELVTALKVL